MDGSRRGGGYNVSRIAARKLNVCGLKKEEYDEMNSEI